MRLGRRLSAGIAEDPPSPEQPQVPADEVIPITAEQTRAEQTGMGQTGMGQREPAERLVDR